MRVDEYADQQQVITAGVVATVLRLLTPFLGIPLGLGLWRNLLKLVFPYVADARSESAKLARTFYDEQRETHTDADQRFNVWLSNYSFEEFARSMEQIRRRFADRETDDSDASHFASRIAREVENGGRRTIMEAIPDDPRALRWARVATGRETCGFCLMLVSRGPVYLSADTAGLDLDDTTAKNLFRKTQSSDVEEANNADGLMREYMTDFHDNCDCKVVPVFDLKNWPGRDAYIRALNAWKEYTEGKSGKQALRALRQAIYYGELDEKDFSIAA